MLRAAIIDDEPDCVRLLALQLKLYCPDVKVIAECTASDEALVRIQEHRPDLVFLDIEMPVMNGFQLLEHLSPINFCLVFVTAYDQFAVKAFRYSALDYLLKPVDAKDLQIAVRKAGLRRWPEKQQLAHLKLQVDAIERQPPDKIALPYQNGVVFAEIRNIVFCQSENNYSRFFTVEGKQHVVAKTLGDIQEILEERNFLRVHRQYLVNLDHIVKYVRGEGNYLVLTGGQQVPLARGQKDRLIERFGWL